MRIQSSSAVTAVSLRDTATTQLNQGSADTSVSGPEQGALDCPVVVVSADDRETYLGDTRVTFDGDVRVVT